MCIRERDRRGIGCRILRVEDERVVTFLWVTIYFPYGCRFLDFVVDFYLWVDVLFALV